MADILAGYAQTAKDALTGGASITGMAANAALRADGAVNNFITSGISSFKRTVMDNVLGRQSPPAKSPGGAQQKGIISNTGLGIYIVFQKDPELLTDTVSSNWHETNIQGQMMPYTVFSNRGVRDVSINILIDAHSSPHPLGHIGGDLDDIQMLTVPHDKAGLPLSIPPMRGGGGGGRQQSTEKFGVPPLVKFIFGGRAQLGFVKSVSVEEMMHGSTPQAAALMLPTRARVAITFGMVDDSRMIASFVTHITQGGSPSGTASPGGAMLTP